MIDKFAPSEEHYWKCRDCRSGKRHGAARLACELKAGEHARAYPGHRVDIWAATRTRTACVEDRPQIPLDELLDVPPY